MNMDVPLHLRISDLHPVVPCCAPLSSTPPITLVSKAATQYSESGNRGGTLALFCPPDCSLTRQTASLHFVEIWGSSSRIWSSSAEKYGVIMEVGVETFQK